MIKTIDQAWRYLSSLIMGRQVFSSESAQPFHRAARLMELLGNPQNKMKVIHIAGTSGKGSTAFYLSRLLHAHGFAVGLHISPHLTDIRERFQINNELVTNDTFLAYLNKVKNAASRMKDTES